MKNGFAILLIGVIAFVLVSPVADVSASGRLFVQGAFLSVIVLAMRASQSGRRSALVLLGLLAVWIAIAVAGAIWDANLAGKMAEGIILILICLIVFMIAAKAVVIAPIVDLNVICGAIACYLLIAIIWAVCFALIEAVQPGSFNWRTPGTPELGELMYFSLTCLTTLGFGDILPQRSLARIFSTLETVTGTLFLSAFVARLVSLYKR
jgi:hypothetical protein